MKQKKEQINKEALLLFEEEGRYKKGV